MFDFLGHNSGKGDRFDPAQDAQRRVRITQAVEHHHADQRLDIEPLPVSSKHLVQAIEPEPILQLGQGPHIAVVV